MELNYKEIDLRTFNPFKYVKGIIGPSKNIAEIIHYAAAVKAFIASNEEWCLIKECDIDVTELEVRCWAGGVLINREIAEKLFNGVLDKTIFEEMRPYIKTK